MWREVLCCDGFSTHIYLHARCLFAEQLHRDDRKTHVFGRPHVCFRNHMELLRCLTPSHIYVRLVHLHSGGAARSHHVKCFSPGLHCGFCRGRNSSGATWAV